MRVAALSDIHGNLPALEAVLADLEHEDLDGIVVAGDTVTGPFSAEVFDLVTSLPGVRFVRGNVERLVVEGFEEYGKEWCVERERLGDGRMRVVAGWPRTLELAIAGLGATLVCHSTPASEDPVYTRITPDEAVLSLLGATDAHVVVCGHTHIQYDRRLSSGLRVVNPGSVGLPYEGRHGAFWAILGPDVEFRRSEYDVEEAVEKINTHGAPVAEHHLEVLLDPPTADEATAHHETMRGA